MIAISHGLFKGILTANNLFRNITEIIHMLKDRIIHILMDLYILKPYVVVTDSYTIPLQRAHVSFIYFDIAVCF